MTQYETMLITSATLDEEASSALITKFKTLIEKNGTINSVDEWGKRRLAYPIDKQDDGVYTLIHFTSGPDFPAELDRRYRITDGVLRSLIIAKTDEQLKAEVKAVLAKEAQAKAAIARAEAIAAAKAAKEAAEAAAALAAAEAAQAAAAAPVVAEEPVAQPAAEEPAAQAAAEEPAAAAPAAKQEAE